MKNCLLVKTSHSNNYIKSLAKQQILYVHPVLHHIIELFLSQIDIDLWYKDIGEYITLPHIGNVNKQYIEYYIIKFHFLNQNGFFADFPIAEFTRYNIKQSTISESMNKLHQIIFDVTQVCNLKCSYCIYDKYYNFNSHDNVHKNMSFEIAKNVIDYFYKIWSSETSTISHKNVTLSFFGGEPLLNVKLIKQVVEYALSLSRENRKIIFSFTMTTNGLLLKENIDFLVENNFKLLISIDGNENHNSFRLYKDGTPSFNDLFSCLKYIQKKHDIFFKKNINFSSVIHSRNSMISTYSFLKKEFKKKPEFGALNGANLNLEFEKEFYTEIAPSLKNITFGEIMDKKTNRYNHKALNIRKIAKSHNALFEIQTKKEFLSIKKPQINTGACLPFSRRIFITTDGRILPCEKAKDEYALGTVINDKVLIDYENCINIYNTICNNHADLCEKCYNIMACPKCHFLESSSKKCSEFIDAVDYTTKLNKSLEYLEKEPAILNKIITQIEVF